MYKESGLPKNMIAENLLNPDKKLTDGSWSLQQILDPEEYIRLNDLQSKSKHFGLFEYPQNR